MGNVAIKRASKFSLLTIVNWSTYQNQEEDKGQQMGQQRASSGPAMGQQWATNKNSKNKKNEEEDTWISAFEDKDLDPFAR